MLSGQCGLNWFYMDMEQSIIMIVHFKNEQILPAIDDAETLMTDSPPCSTDEANGGRMNPPASRP